MCPASPTNLNVNWAFSYGGSLDDVAYQIEPIDTNGDGIRKDGYIVVGDSSTPTNVKRKNAWLLRLKPDGSVRWSRTFDAISKNDQAFAVEQTRDNNYFIACGSSQNDHFNPGSTASTDLWVIKLNLDGTTVSGWTTTWSSIVHQGKFYGSTGAGFGDPDIGYDIKEDLDGNFVIVGRVGSKNHDVGSGNNVQGDGDIWVLKISSSGTKLKDTVYHGAYSGLDFARSVTVDCGTGHYIVSGFCTSCESNSTNTELIFLDISSDFDSMSVHTYGNPNYDHGSFNVIQPGTICLL